MPTNDKLVTNKEKKVAREVISSKMKKKNHSKFFQLGGKRILIKSFFNAGNVILLNKH